jgi:hypothetical protein
MTKNAYCVFIETVCEGRTPLIWDEKGHPFLFENQYEAEREIAESLINRLNQFLEGDREFDDAITIEEYAEPVEVLEDGSVIDSNGIKHTPRPSR